MISLLYAGNDRMLDGLLISTLSAARHTASPLTVYVMTMDYTEKNPAFTPLTPEQCAFVESVLQRHHPENRVVLLEVGDLYHTVLAENPNEENSYTPYTLLRLLCDRISGLPDKILYVDTDTVFTGDAAVLFDTDLTGYELAAVRDRYGCHLFGVNYFNAGVLLLNLSLLRETGALSRAAAACKAKKIFLSDQSALNHAVKKKRLLPRRFNEQKNLRQDTIVRHFSMTIHLFPRPHKRNIKPWQVEQVQTVLGVHSLDDLFAEYRTLITEWRNKH